MGHRDGPKMMMRSTSSLLVAVILLVAIASAIIVRLMLSPDVAGDGETCGTPVARNGTDVLAPGVLLPAEEELVNFVWVFDADETVHKVQSLFHWQEPGGRPKSLDVNDELIVRFPNDLANDSNDGFIPTEQLSASAVVTPNGVLLSVCVDTSGAKPDRYSSALKFEDREIQAAPFTIDVTVKNRAEWIPIAAIIAGLAVALIMIVLNFASATSPPPLKAIVVIVLAGVLTLFVGKPWAVWQNDPTWGKDRFDWLTLLAATALGLIGAIASGETIQGFVRATTEKKRDDAEKDPNQKAESGQASSG